MYSKFRMHNYFLKSLSFRITCIFAFFSLIILFSMGFAIHSLLIHHFNQQDQNALTGKVKLIQNLLGQHQDSQQDLIRFLDHSLVGHQNLLVHVEQSSGEVLFSNFPAQLKVIKKTGLLNQNWMQWQFHQKTYMGMQAYHPEHLKGAASSPHTAITVGIDTSEHIAVIEKFRFQLFIIGLIGILFLIVFGWLAVKRGLKPIIDMSAVAKNISAKHLSERLQAAGLPVELQGTAAEFNSMLDRLEKSLARLNDFSSDLAHEIRTPVSNLMMQTQVCLSQHRSNAEYREVLFSNYEEFERLAKMIADILFLAKAEHGLIPLNIQPVDLKEEFKNLFDFYEALALEKQMTLQLAGDAILYGEAAMLRRAFSNLISNAIKYGKADSQIQISVVQGEHIAIEFKNEADPLTADQISRLFDRFYRVDASRQKMIEGTGLGLAITQSIIQMHYASIAADSEHSTICFRLKFPNLNHLPADQPA